MQEFLRYEDVPLDQLNEFPGNARRSDVDQLVSSIRRHGQYRTLMIREDDEHLVIIAGNHTFQALLKMGATHARCEIHKMTDREALEINLQDNKSNDLAWYEPDGMREQLEELQGNYDGTGWTEKTARKYVDPPGGDAEEEGDAPESWNILVICTSEKQQNDLLERFFDEGLDCKALVT